MGQTPRLIMIQWCVSLLLLYIVFVIGIDQTQSPAACTAVAALLHYFTLSSVLWMGIEGVNLYILLVRVMDVPRTRRFMPIACLVAWGNNLNTTTSPSSSSSFLFLLFLVQSVLFSLP